MEERERELAEAEAEAKRLAAEAARVKEMESKEMLHVQTEDTFAAIHDLDDALKAFQGALGLSEVRLYSCVCTEPSNCSLKS